MSRNRVTLANIIENDQGLYVLTFGQHIGKILKRVPIEYVRWLASQETKVDNGQTSRIARAYLRAKEPVLNEPTPVHIPWGLHYTCLFCKNEFVDEQAYILELRLPSAAKHILYAHEGCVKELEK
jgi:hypothetical protein